MNMAKDILNKQTLQFKDNKELEKYYEKKYSKKEHYEGWIVHGFNASELYHEMRIRHAIDLLMPNKTDKILDAGCGSGQITLRIADKCKSVISIDISKNAFKHWARKPKNVKQIKMNLEELRFKDNTFDKIICVETIEHLLHPEKALSEMYRVLKSGGLLSITYPNINFTAVRKVERTLHLRKYFPISEHLNEWDYKTLRMKATSAGFQVTNARSFDFDISLLNNIQYINNFFARFAFKLRQSIKNAHSNSFFIILQLKKP